MNVNSSSPAPAPVAKKWYEVLYIQVLIGVFLGICVGYFYPQKAKEFQVLGTLFIKLVKMVIAPIIFCTVVHGIASMSDARKLGRVGIKAIVYFEVVSTLALVIGLVVVNIWKPGDGMHIDIATLDTQKAHNYVEQAAHSASASDFVLNVVPKSYFDAFAGGDILQVLLISLLTGFAIAALGEKGKPALHVLEQGNKIIFGIMHIIVKIAPIGAFGAMSFTVGSYGIGALKQLAELMAGFYLTAFLFVIFVLGSIAWFSGFSIFRFIVYIRDELFLVLGTSSSETALPGLLEKTRRLGCSESTAGFVIPMGYSFNLDGTNIYMSMAAIFLAQATDTPLTLGQQLTLLAVSMFSSKGATGVTGAGFITLAATLSSVKTVPVEALAILIGIDRFMSECRSLTNFIGNGVATVVISRWENEVDPATLRERMKVPKLPLP